MPNLLAEVLDHCESCGRALYVGDMAFSYSDGPTFCWQHSPTWNDLKREQDELIADGTFEEAFEGAENAQRARQNVLDKIAAGDGDKHVASLLS